MIAILLSTYNGEKYIKEQIESLLDQTIKNWFLVVRDDGSHDKTVEILKEYSTSYPNKIFIDGSVRENLGAGKSFMHLLKITHADYYMFCDQDDVWMPDKIERTLAKVKAMESEFGKDVGIGVFTDLEVVDSNLNVIKPSLWKGDNRHPEYVRDFYKQWTNRHAAYGCTMLINRAAKDEVLPFRQFEGVNGAHDAWIEYILIKKGHIDYLDETTIHYRQHNANVIGANMGITYKDEVRNVVLHPRDFINKIKKDFKRARMMPFHISFIKILRYRILQTIQSLLK